MRTSRLFVGLVVGAVAMMARADLSGPYEPQHWMQSGIAEGTTSITPPSGLTDTIAFDYAVDLGNPGGGVTFRTATFGITADRSGTLCFDYHYTGNHRFAATEIYLEVFAQTSEGTTSMVLVDTSAGPGFVFEGSVEIEVEEGMDFGVIVGGGNFDSNSRIDGTVTLTEFSRPLALDGAYAMDNWSSSGISEGTTEITPETGDAVVGSFAYAVDLGNPGSGVTFRTATFSAPAGGTGTVSFDFDYTGDHRFFQTQVYLEVFAETSDGTNSIVLVDEENGNGHSYSGSVSIAVEKGMEFGIIVGGGNFDSNSRIDGQVDISKFRGPRTFDGAMRLENWSGTGISEGTTSTDPTSGAADRAEFSYAVDLGNPGSGVTFRTAEWGVTSDHTGVAAFDWDYTGNHRFFQTQVYLEIFSETSGGTNSYVLVNEENGNDFSYSGSIEIPVEAGMRFGVITGGGNFDSNSRIDGKVGIESLCFGLCPSDFNSDGTVNTLDVLAFLNAWSAQDPSADFNGDGTVNTLDVLAFLNAWTSGC